MYVGVLEMDVLLPGDVHSLKEKRSHVRRIVADVRRRFEVSAAEAGHLDLRRRCLIGMSLVAADASHCREVLEACERYVAGLPELDIVGARLQVISSDE